jgi:hypothetical protein
MPRMACGHLGLVSLKQGGILKFNTNMKTRTLAEIKADLQDRKQCLSQLQSLGDKACSEYDLSLGYDANFYLRSGMIENQIRYFQDELAEATQGMLF